MGTRGYRAYRYRGTYYRQYLPMDAYPSGYGIEILRSIPRNPAVLEKWIAKIANALPDEKARVRLLGLEKTAPCVNSDWTLGHGGIEWTYVMDLDNRVFTVNGVLHFKFDNLPPLRTSGTKLGFIDYLETSESPTLPKIPAEYLTSLEFWPKIKFNAEKAEQEYSVLQPIVTSFSEWNTPSWNTLSVSQRLSTRLIETSVYDYSDDLKLCYYHSIWFNIGVFCWNVANVAATSHILSPPADASQQDDIIHVFNLNYSRQVFFSAQHSNTHYYLQNKGTMGHFYQFRGCLVTFCPRLDEPAYMTHKVVEMAHRLRRNDREQGVGVIMSGWHIVAVTINGSEVRHSPVLDLHDGTKPKDGALLLIHLLSPTFTCSKTPWLAPPPPQVCDTHPTLPDEVIRQIIHFTDFETYHRIPLVSRYFRSIYLAHPRVGNHILLGHTDSSPDSEPIFQVRSTDSSDSKPAILKRIKSSIPEPENAVPIVEYRNKSWYNRPVLQTGLAGMFQCHQTATRPFDLPPIETTKAYDGMQSQVSLKPMPFADMISGIKYPSMRVQTMEGVWEMVGVDAVEGGTGMLV